MADDLVQKLRTVWGAYPVARRAADEIERLRAEVARVDAEVRQHMLRAISNGQAALVERNRAEKAERELAELRERMALGGFL